MLISGNLLSQPHRLEIAIHQRVVGIVPPAVEAVIRRVVLGLRRPSLSGISDFDHPIGQDSTDMSCASDGRLM